MYQAIATSPSVWAGVVVIPSSKAYEPSKEIEQIEEHKEEENPAVTEAGMGEEQAANGEGQSENVEPKMETN